MVMIGLSLLDKSHQIENQLPNSLASARSVRLGWKIISGAAVVGLVAAFFVVPMRNLAIEAIYVLVVGFILIGTILILNSSSHTMNEKGLIIERSMFKTTDTFNIAAIGICGILAVLYGFFW
jgi:ABC-type branched-subunit amino acid transport system permease subunit